MNLKRTIDLARVLLASAAGAVGIATIIASGSGGSSGGTDESGNPLPVGAATWFKSFGGPNDDIAYSAIPTRDGGYAFAGILNDNGETGDVWLTKLDAVGDVQWQRAYGERLLLEDSLWSLTSTRVAPAQGPDGSIWFLGAGKLEESAGSRDNLVVAKLGADGNPAWSKSFDSGAHPDFAFFNTGDEAQERPQSVTPTVDGGALIASWSYVRAAIPAGSAAQLRELRYLWLLKLSSTGFLEWTRRVTDDQFLYVLSLPIFGSGSDQVAVRPLENGDLLISIVADLEDAWCEACSLREFTSTRFLHLRSGGELVVNARVPYERASFPFSEDRFTNRALPAALLIDTDGDGTPEGYLLAGNGTDIGLILGDLGTRERAMVAVMEPDGFIEREQFYDEWPENSRFTTIDRLCLVGTECGYLLSGPAASDVCLHEPLLAHIDADLSFERGFRLVRENDPSCMDMVPLRLETEIPSDDPPARDLQLIVRSRLPGSGTSWDFGIFSARLLPADDGELSGTYVGTSIDVWPHTLSVTSDGQALGIVGLGAPPHDEVLTRTNANGEVTLSRVLSAPFDRHGTYDAGFALAQAADEGFVVVGQTNSFASETGSSAAWVIRTDRDGRLIWQRRLPGLEIKVGAIPNVLAVGDGFLFGAFMKSDGHAAVVKLDTRGDILWLARLPTGDCIECEIRLAALASGDLVVAGTTANDNDAIPWLARVNAQGGVAWLRRYTIDDWQFTDVDITPDGNVLVAGRQPDSAAAWRFSPDGELLWNRIYSVGSLEQGMAVSHGFGSPRAEVLADGGFLMAMSVVIRSGEDNVLLLRADAAGVAQWERLIGARFRETVYELQALDDGGALLAGHSNSLGDNLEAWVARLGPDGRVSSGCNAGLGEYSQRLGTSMDLAAQNLRTQVRAIAPLPPADMTSQATTGGEFMPSANEVVVARQCSGSAGPENPPPPPARFALTVTPSSTLPGAITSSPLGISCGTVGGACSAQFDAEAVVMLRPDSQIISSIDHWEGCDNSENGFCIVRMTSARSVHVVLRNDGPRVLTISAITGHGSVSDAAGLNCSSSESGLQGTCSASYGLGDTITLIAIPGQGQSLLSWGGSCTPLADPTRASVVMDAHRTCSVVFSGVLPGSPILRIIPEAFDNGQSVDPSTIGRITSSVPGIDCGADCSEQYPRHSSVTVTAEVDAAVSADWEFERFVCPVIPIDQINARSASIQMTGDVTCTARFRNTIKRLYLDITDEGPGSPLGRVVSEPLRLECSADCDRPFETNQAVILRARPSGSASLRTWQGCDQTGPDPDPGVVPPLPGQPVPPVCYVTMSSTRTVAAFFEPLSIGGDGDRTLTVAFAGAGSPGGFVNSTPAGISCSTEGGTCSRVFPTGTVVRLLAGTYPGTLFGNFVGCSRNDPDGDPTTFDCEVDMVDDRFIQIQLLGP